MDKEQHSGPYDLVQLRAMYLSGAITASATYWDAGQDKWRSIKELPSIDMAEQRAAISSIKDGCVVVASWVIFVVICLLAIGLLNAFLKALE
jgi:hypothetical protein